MSQKKIKGVYTAIVTPFNDDLSIDYKSFYTLLDKQIEGKVDGVLIGGTTGEKPTLTEHEFQELVEKSVAHIKKRVKVMVGTGTNSTDKSVKETKLAADLGADFALVVGPYYNKPMDAGYIEHFTKIADASKIPICLYNIPGRTGSNMKPSVVLELAKHKNIIAIKEATGSIDQAQQIIKKAPKHFSLLSGDDELTLPLMALGGDGVISVAGNQIPQEMKALVYCLENQKYQAAQEIHYKFLDLFKINFIETNPIPIKTALHMMGLIKNENFRLPLCRMTPENKAKLKTCLEKYELI